MNERSALFRRALRYGLAGLVATVIYFVSVMLMVERAHVAPVPAAVLATVIVIVSSYVINRAFVFETNRTHVSAFSRFVVASLLGIALNAGLMHVATVVMAWPYLAGAALSTTVVPPMNFFVNYLWAFRPTR
jgi:putative flippase GtrA